MRRSRRSVLLLSALLFPAAGSGAAQGDPGIVIRAPVLVLRHARVVDGTGAPARDAQSLILRNGRIESVGPDRLVTTPPGADSLDLSGRTVLPGLVMMHEHLFYPTGVATYAWTGFPFARFLLASGVTTARTAGAINPYADLDLRGMIEAGQVPGPDLFLTGPVMEGPGLALPGIRIIRDTADGRRAAAVWSTEGMDDLKIYNRIDSATAAAIIGEAHARGLKVAGHVCALSLREAAALRIDALEHGLFAASDFDPSRRPGVCSPNQIASLAALRPEDPRIAELAETLARSGVAVTSTLPVFETYLPHRGAPDSIVALLLPQLAEAYRAQRAGWTATPPAPRSGSGGPALPSSASSSGPAGCCWWAPTRPGGAG
jgi:enamidase